MMEKMRNAKKIKGFTLIELIVVIAILGILAAIAIPRFSGLREDAAIKSDAATAAQIVSAARIQETQTGFAVNSVNQSGTLTDPPTAAGPLLPKNMTVPTKSQSGAKGVFSISGGGTDPYVVTWVRSGTNVYTYTENVPFTY